MATWAAIAARRTSKSRLSVTSTAVQSTPSIAPAWSRVGLTVRSKWRTPSVREVTETAPLAVWPVASTSRFISVAAAARVVRRRFRRPASSGVRPGRGLWIQV